MDTAAVFAPVGGPSRPANRSDRRRIAAGGQTWADFGALAAIVVVHRVRRGKSAFLRQ
jgi:hypothetical protein